MTQTHHRWEVIGRAHQALRLVAFLSMAGFAVAVAVVPYRTLTDAVFAPTVLGLGAAVEALVASTRIEIAPDLLRVTNLLHVTTIGLTDIASIDDNRGLCIRLHNRRTLRPMAYGSSVLGNLTGNRRAKSIAALIRERTAGAPAPAGTLNGRSIKYNRALLLVIVLPTAFVAVSVIARGMRG